MCVLRQVLPPAILGSLFWPAIWRPASPSRSRQAPPPSWRRAFRANRLRLGLRLPLVLALACALLGMDMRLGAAAEPVASGVPKAGIAVADPNPAVAKPTRVLCAHGLPEGQILSLRARPRKDGQIVAHIARDACGLTLVGRCASAWCRMAHEGRTGWVDTRYVGIFEMPPTASATPPPNPRATATAATTTTTPAGSSPTASQPAEASVSPAVPGQRPVAVDVIEPRRVAPSPRQKSVRAATRVVRRAAQTRPPQRVASRAPARAETGCVIGVASWDTLRVRLGPGAGHPAIGAIPHTACRVRPAGPCLGAWCRVAW